MQGFVALVGPLVGGDGGLRRTLEVGHHIARHQLVAVQHMLARRPVHRLHHKGAEAAAAFLQALDAGDAVVGGADDPGAAFRHHINDFFRRAVHDLGAAHSMLKVLALVASSADAGLLEGFLAGVGQVDGQHQAPVEAVHGLVVFGGRFLADVPEFFQVGALGHFGVAGGGDGQHGGAVLAGQGHAGGGLHGGHGDGHMGRLVGAQLEHGFVELKPVALVGDGFFFGEQAHDDAQGFVHTEALFGGVDAHHIGVAGEGAGADAEHHAAAGHMVQLGHPVGDHKGVVVGQADHAGAEFDVLGAVGGDADENLRGGDDFPAGAVVFADPGFVEAEVVQPLDEFQVAFQGQGGVFAGPVERAHKDAELHTVG